MKALIIEDEDLAAQRLVKLLNNLEPEMEVSGPIDTIEGAVKHFQSNPQYDLIFLDIQLADGKSFLIFDKVKIDIPIIFTTAYDEFAIRAFELNSIDYLLKPINTQKLRNALDKLKKLREFYSKPEANRDLVEMLRSLQLPASYKTRFLVNKGDTLIPVSTREIAYFYAEDKVVFLVTHENKKYLINYTLEELEQKLDPKQFFRINRQFLASLASIRKVYNYFNYKLKLDLLPDPDIEIIVSKARTSDFKAWMNGE
jgi:Response regulator of the LytR/AlgR family